MRFYSLLLSLLFMLSCSGKHDHAAMTKSEKSESKTTDAPVKMLPSSAVFKTELTALLSLYFEVKDHLVATNLSSTVSSASRLATTTQSLKYNLDETSLQQAKSTMAHITQAANSISSSKDVELARVHFEQLSLAFTSLVETFGSPNQEVYQQHCPMAFNDKGADWLSREKEIRNPYFGNKMLKCGFVVKKIEARAL